MKKLQRAFSTFVRFNDGFAEFSGRILSWSIWLTLLIVCTGGWIMVHDVSHGRWDPHYDNLVLVLTITTALDAAAAKVFQLALRRSDERRDEQMMLILEGTANLTVSIREELDRAAERDEAQIQRDIAAAKRDQALRALVTKLIDHVEDRRKGVKRRA